MIKIIFLDIDDVLTNEVMWRYIDVRVQHHIDMQTIDARDINSGAKQYSYPNTKPYIKKR